MTNTSPKSSSLKIGNIVLVLVLVIAAMASGIFIANQGLVNLFKKPAAESTTAVPVNYNDVSKYLDSNVIVSGYVIVPNTEEVCFAAWPTCKLWLDNDPTEPGMGLHEVEFKLGDGANQITASGQLHDYTGRAIPITQNEAFSWYHITVTGKVTICKSGNCVIEAISVKVK